MDALERRRLGSTGLTCSALAMGCAWIGAAGGGDDQAVAAVRRALDLGIDWFDTDPSYQHGQAEQRLGRALRGISRDRYHLAGKIGTHPQRPGDFSPDAVRWTLQQTLTPLGVDHLDALLLHDPDRFGDPPLGDALAEMIRLRDRGLVRHLGIGCRSPVLHRWALSTGELQLVVSFLDYTLLNQTAVETTIPLGRHHDAGLMLASPLAMGALAGDEPDVHHHPTAHRMWRWCRQRGHSVRDLAIQFCLAAPSQPVVLAGPASPDQVDHLVTSAQRPIDPEMWEAFAWAFSLPRALLPEWAEDRTYWRSFTRTGTHG